MLLKQYKTYFSEQLISVYPQTEIDTFFFFLIDEYLNLQRIDLTLRPNFEIPSNKKTLLNEALLRLKKEEPIQYILGKTEFYGFPFMVNENTLIPRPETEELVEWVIQEINKKQELLSILDIGTGTGCIPISLKKHVSKTSVSAIDISEEALSIARENAALNETDIRFMLDDLFSPSASLHDSRYDLIISNPPYILIEEKSSLDAEVSEFEPDLALFCESTEKIYNAILEFSEAYLAKKGVVFLELHEIHAGEAKQIFDSQNWTAYVEKDYDKKERFLVAKKA